jgi:hypothetical protein
MPGILSTLSRVLTRDEKEHHLVICYSIDLACSLLKKSFEDDLCADLINQKNRNLMDSYLTAKPLQISTSSETTLEADVRDVKWLDTAVGNIHMLLPIFTKFRMHSHDAVRLSLVHFCTGILMSCFNSLRSCSSILAESLVLLSSDSSESVKAESINSISKLLENVDFKQILVSNLNSMFGSFKHSIQKATSDKSKWEILQKVIGYLEISGNKAFITVQLHAEQISNALIWVLEPSFTNLKIVEDRFKFDVEHVSKSDDAFLTNDQQVHNQKKEFKHFQNEIVLISVKRLCKLMVQNGIL